MTKKIELKTSNSCSEIYIGGNYKTAFDLAKNFKTVLISDKNIFSLYPDIFKKQNFFIIEPDESEKTIETIIRIWDFFQANKVDKNSFVLGVGGGLVCDITGFAASTWMRGTKFGFVASSFLAQVDASIGGKNGINFNNVKNNIGIIRQPEFVISALEMLKTLKDVEFMCGLSECIKIASIADENLFSFIEKNKTKILDRNIEYLEECIYKAVKLKVDYVEKDENEKNIRKELNFGHTLAHGIEVISKLNHGLAVSRGIAFAIDFSLQKEFLNINDFNRINKLLVDLNFPVDYKFNKEQVMNKIIHDKKKSDKNIDFIFLEKIGKAKIETIDYSELKKAIYDLC